MQTQTTPTKRDAARVTVVLPGELWERVKQLAPAGRRSQWISEALEAEANRQEEWKLLEDIRQFTETLRAQYGETSGSADGINELREERDAELTGLH